MAKNKRKAIVACRQDSAHIVGPNVHDNDGDGSAVLGLQVATAFEADAVSCPLLGSGSGGRLHRRLSDDEILDKDQLDFNFTDEECEDSPRAPAMLPAPPLSSPPPLLPVEASPPLLPKKVMLSAPIIWPQKVVYETLSKYWALLSCTLAILVSFRWLQHVVPTTNKIGPQPPPQISPPMVQGHPQENNIQEASKDAARPEAALENSAGWVIVVSRKSSKQCKGKAVGWFLRPGAG
uniref:Uncharacterized protein n=1 Tax=Populus alba TaxID=43335 RepID=A0A4U5QEP6_POPAL|nr:hypothetical protein D5086_0000103300 [Populus alba]